MKMQRIGILNGPNLNSLGERETELYGAVRFEDFFSHLQSKYKDVELHYYQSNVEGFLIDQLQEWNDKMNGIIINAGAYTHTSIALADCLAYMKVPIVEVHITNIYAREHFRQHSYLSKHCKAVIAGMGLKGYEVAIDFLKDNI